MLIIVLLLVSFGFAVLCGKFLDWCGRNDVAEDYYKSEGMNSEGKIVNAVW